jgi:hypothetical protein
MTATDHPLNSGHHYTDDEMHNEDVAHEHGDVNVRSIIAFGVAMFVVIGISSALMLGLFTLLEKQAKGRDPAVSPLTNTNPTPRGPQLLTNEPKYFRDFRKEEEGKLEGYGWVDQGQGIARVPIDSAKKLVVQHGLPVRAGAPDEKTLGTHAPAFGESSGGRAIPVPKPPAAAAQPGAAAPASEQQPPAKQPQAPGGQEIKK